MPTLADLQAATPTCPKCMRPGFDTARGFAPSAVRRLVRWWHGAWYCPVHGRVRV